MLLSAATYGKDKMPAASRSGRAKPLQYRMASNDAPLAFSAWTALEAPDPAFWVPRGYVLINLDLRGWGTSDGDPEPFGPTEGDDLHDAIEWAAAQPWSNGKVGRSRHPTTPPPSPSSARTVCRVSMAAASKTALMRRTPNRLVPGCPASRSRSSLWCKTVGGTTVARERMLGVPLRGSPSR